MLHDESMDYFIDSFGFFFVHFEAWQHLVANLSFYDVYFNIPQHNKYSIWVLKGLELRKCILNVL